MRRWSWKRTTPVIKRWALALEWARARLPRPPSVRPPSGRAGRTPAVVPGAVLAAALLLAGLWALRVPAPQAVTPAQQGAGPVHAAAQPLPTVQALPVQAPSAPGGAGAAGLTPVHREAAASPLPEPGADPFRAYARIAGVGSSGSPGAVRADDPLREPGDDPLRDRLMAPAPRLELPALPVPPPPVAPPQPRSQPQRETLQRYLARAGWRLEAVSLGQEASVLLSKDGVSGLWRVGEELEADVRLVRVEPGRVELARGKERAYLEVSP